jgi:hypothetical protein
VLGALLGFPALRGTLEVDDYFHRSILSGHWSTPSVLLDLFTFMPPPGRGRRFLIDLGFVPWWGDPDLRVSLLRPVTAAIHLFDYWLWPDSFRLQHVHSLLWYLVGVLVVAAVFRRVMAPTTAGLATLLYAVDDAHALTSMWIANRNALVALVFGALAILFHVRWRREQRHRFLVVALGLLGIGLLGAEAAVGALAYVVAYQICLDEGPWRRRLIAVLPCAGVVVVWRIAYNAMGYGVGGSGLYIDPGRDPFGLLAAAVIRIPVLLFSQWTQVPTDLWMVMSRRMQLGLAAGGVTCCLGLIALFLPLLRRSAACRFWGLGMLLAAIPVSAAFPMDRLLLFLGVGAFGLLACLVEHGGWLGGPAPLDRSRLRDSIAVLLLVMHVPIAILTFPFRGMTMMAFGDITNVLLHRLPSDPAVAKQTFVFVNGVDVLTAYVPVIRSLEGTPFPRQTVVLASPLVDNELTRVDDRTLVIRPAGGFLAHDGDRLLRNLDRPFHEGERIQRSDYEVTVMETTTDGRPAACRFVFNMSLNDQALAWFAWRDGEIERFEVPSVGETVVVKRSLLNVWLGRDHPVRVLSTKGW